MTGPCSYSDGGDPTELDAPVNIVKRAIVLKVRVNDAEKAEIDRQRGRLSSSAFLRDRGLNRDQVYDPTYASIGAIYQSARNLRDSANYLAEASGNLDRFLGAREHACAEAGGGGETSEIGSEIRELAERLLLLGMRIEQQADDIGEQARDLGKTHLQEMLKRYSSQVTKPRRRK